MSDTYLEQKIKQLLYDMGSNFASVQHRREMFHYQHDDIQDEVEEIISMDIENFYKDAKSVYKLIYCYIESLGNLQYLSLFKRAILPFLTTNKVAFKGEQNNYDGEIHNVLLTEIWDFLYAYEAFGETDIEYLLKRSGIYFLENILENTAVIINQSGKKPKSEVEVYKCVKPVINAVFPDHKTPTTAFVTIAQEYKPDILIPSLNCGIEYKFAKTESKLKSTIDQIFADVSGYDNHDTYKLFYAVFYVCPDIWGKAKFMEVWKEKKFPKNWKGIYIVG